jgi:hypothetical protein
MFQVQKQDQPELNLLNLERGPIIAGQAGDSVALSALAHCTLNGAHFPIMLENLGNPEFWIALGIGLGSLGLFIYWLRTGGRKPE